MFFLENKEHWSSSGGSCWPNTFLSYSMLCLCFFPLMRHLSETGYITPNSCISFMLYRLKAKGKYYLVLCNWCCSALKLCCTTQKQLDLLQPWYNFVAAARIKKEKHIKLAS